MSIIQFSDLSQHPTGPPAVRTRSTSTLNSESSGPQALKQSQPPTPNPDRQNSSSTVGAATNVRRSADQRILVVWLERVEDIQQFPYGSRIDCGHNDYQFQNNFFLPPTTVLGDLQPKLNVLICTLSS